MRKWVIFFLLFALVITLVLQSAQTVDWSSWVSKQVVETQDVSLNAFVASYQSGSFSSLTLEDATLLKWYEQVDKTGSVSLLSFKKDVVIEYFNVYQTKKPIDTSLADLGISITGDTIVEVVYNEQWIVGFFMEHILPLLFFLLIIVVFFKFFWPKGGGFPFSVKAGKLNTKKDSKIRFDDVAGMEEVKEELVEIVDFLTNPKKYHDVGARPPKGVLLYGVPGSGKTLLAKAVAGESKASFFSASGSEFMEMLVGMWAAKVRELFTKAKAATPAIIFIDEIDAIGKKRWGGHTGGHQEQEQTLNQILTEMDGFWTNTNIIVIAATNRPDTLDPALLRSWRFDRKIMVGTPTLDERVLIFKYYFKNKKIAGDVNVESLARRTSGLVGADIENMVNEAAMKIAKDERKLITNDDFEYSLEKILMGPEKKIKTMNAQERKVVSYHELGHAVTGYKLKETDPVEKISIVSRGRALGVTRTLPQEDRYLSSKAKFLDELVMLVGGRAAEENFFGKENITTGASNDFEKATNIARDMILKYGMDDEMGQIMYLDRENDDYNGHFRRYSEKTSELADKKVQKLLADAYVSAKKILSENEELIHVMAEILLEKEYLSRDEFEKYMKDVDKAREDLEKVKKAAKKKKAEQKRTAEKKKEDVELIE